MFRISVHSRMLQSIAITMLVAGLTAAQAQMPAGPKRPAAVPADYVITPFGYFHSSCVKHLAKGDDVRRDEKAIRHANGMVENIQVCAFPHFKADGAKLIGEHHHDNLLCLSVCLLERARRPEHQRWPDYIPVPGHGRLRRCSDDHSACLGMELRLRFGMGYRQLELLRLRHRF
jgi:hypothetical protein